MCPLRVFVIFLSILIALIAMMMALAKDPTEEELEAERLEQELTAKKSLWTRFTDLATGRYLYREIKRLCPFLFKKESEEEAVESDDNSVQQDEQSSAAASNDLNDETLNSLADVVLPQASAPSLDDFELIQSNEAVANESSSSAAVVEGEQEEEEYDAKPIDEFRRKPFRLAAAAELVQPIASM